MCENTISVNPKMAGCYRLQRWAVATAIRCGARAQGGANPTAHLQRTTLANLGGAWSHGELGCVASCLSGRKQGAILDSVST